jgi:Mg2+/Co2+ transporter CorB
MDASTFGKGEVIIKRNAVFKCRKVGLKIYKIIGNLTLVCIAIVCVVNVLANEGDALIRNGMCVGAHF